MTLLRSALIGSLVVLAACDGSSDNSTASTSDSAPAEGGPAATYDLLDRRSLDPPEVVESFVAARVWPGSDVAALREKLLAEAAGDDVYVFECPFSEESWDSFRRFVLEDRWRNEGEATAVLTWGPRIDDEPLSGRFRSCVVQLTIKGGSDAEWDRILERAQDLGLRYDFRSTQGDCEIDDAAVALPVDQVWSNRTSDPLHCG